MDEGAEVQCLSDRMQRMLNPRGWQCRQKMKRSEETRRNEDREN